MSNASCYFLQMALPTDFPNWGSNGNYTTGPDIGTPVGVAPSSGEIAEGFVPDTAAVPQYVNYLFTNASAWFAYLKALPARSEFLSSSFAWLNLHTFATRPRLATPTTRSSRLAVQKATEASGTGTKYLNTDYRPQFDTSGTQKYTLDFKVPVGGTLTGCTVVVLNGGASGTVTVELWKSEGTLGTSVMLGTNAVTMAGGTASLGVTSPADFAAQTPTDLSYYWITVHTTDNSGVSNWDRASVQWTDPGFLSGLG